MTALTRRDAAYTEFVVARQTQLRRLAYAICGDWHRADDVLQTALVKLYVAWPRVEDGGAESYVRRIIVRANLDEYRRPWRRERPGLDGHDTAAHAEGGVEERDALVECLRQLPLMQRKVIALRYLVDLSVEATSRELGITTGTVKSHTSRALAHLQTALATEDT